MSFARDFLGTERFRVIRRLGAGGMGVVYEALDTERGETVALKTVQHLDPQSLYRFKNEFRALYDLDHPNLISLGELIEDDGTWFFTMELLRGDDFLAYVRSRETDTLAQGTPPRSEPPMPRMPGAPTQRLSDSSALLPRNPLPGREATRDGAPPGGADPGRATGDRGFDEHRLRGALEQLARALLALHDAGKIHCDIKPSNILVDGDGHLTLLDFGLITNALTEHSASARILGTAAYMAPEQAIGEPVGPAADWYAFGTLLFQALTGRLPFPGPPLFVLQEKQRLDPVSPRALDPGVPDDLDALCLDLLRRNPRLRPAGADVLRRLGASRPAGSRPRTARGERVFIGRESELAALSGAFADTRAGGAVTVFVHGDSGVGKSTLLRELARALERDHEGAIVVTGQCYENEAVPYKALDKAVDELSAHLRRIPEDELAPLIPDNAALLSRVFPVLGRVDAIALAPWPSELIRDPYELRARAFAALRELLTRLARRRPLIVVIDDLQWADADSQLLLADLMRAPDAPPLLCLISSRQPPGELERPGGGASPVASFTDLRVLELGPLTPREAHELASMLLRDAALGEAISAEDIAAETRGHPLYIDELVRHAVASGAVRQGAPHLDRVIADRLETLPEPACRIARLVAVAGIRLPQTAIRRAADLTAGEFAKHVALLRASRMVRTTGVRLSDIIEPYHDRVRESVVAALAPGDRERCHRLLAAALEHEPDVADRVELLFWHLKAAGEPARAARCAREAADQAAAAFAFERAAELYREAIEMGSFDGGELDAIVLSLADALGNAGRGADAAEVYMRAAERTDGEIRRECQRRAAFQWLITGHIHKGYDAIRAVLADLGVAMPRTPWAALRSLVWQRVQISLALRRIVVRDEHEVPRDQLVLHDVLSSAAEGLGIADVVRGADFQARTTLLALRLGERRRLVRACALEGVLQIGQGGRTVPGGLALLERASRLAASVGDPELLWFVSGLEGIAAYLVGRYPTALERLREALSIAPTRFAGMTMELNTAREFLMGTWREIGLFGEWERAAHGYIRDALRRGDLMAETNTRQICSLLYLIRDEPDEARRNLERVQWVPPAGSYHLQNWMSLQARAELALYTGAVPDEFDAFQPGFRKLRRSLMVRFQYMRAAGTALWGRLSLAMAERATAGQRAHHLRQASRAARSLAGEHTPFADVWGTLLRAGIAAVNGDDARARVLLADAARIADGCGMTVFAALARRLDGLLAGGDDSRDAVADAERWMTGERIRDPARVTRIFAPGFARLE